MRERAGERAVPARLRLLSPDMSVFGVPDERLDKPMDWLCYMTPQIFLIFRSQKLLRINLEENVITEHFCRQETNRFCLTRLSWLAERLLGVGEETHTGMQRGLNVSGWVGVRGQVLGLQVGSGVGVRDRVDIIVITLSPMLSHIGWQR